MIHEVKCWPIYFQPLYVGTKEFEVRVNDRNYQVEDSLFIREWNPMDESYTGRTMVKRVIFIIQGVCGLPTDLCVMQLR